MSALKIQPSEASAQPWWLAVAPTKRTFCSHTYIVLKRCMDLLIVSSAIPIWLPLFALCTILIKATAPHAPIFFIQERTGQGGRRFRMYKFRTMVVNAEALKHQYKYLNELQWPDFKITNDPRITRIGRFLRKTSLDELPQLWNVLRGDMSLVGPRPTSFSAATYLLWQTERLDVKPGVTGLWQLYGRSTTEFDARLRLDIAYIERQGLWMDVQILVRTIASVLQRRGAH